MRINSAFMVVLFSTTTSSVLAMGGAAFAQQADSPSNKATLDEVVVTATRQSSTTHNIPLSITAVTPQQLERQGLKTAQDLVSAVTSLRISPANGGGVAGLTSNPDIAIRGIRSTTGSATTGIYVDEVPLQQRSLNGPTGGGSVFPNLFDLERVEVLKGPQGTLYGGSSEGGTLRFITPSPSFSTNSLYMKGEGASTDGGDASYEGGIEAGGPIVKDKLAIRISGWDRHDGGYIDHVSAYTGNLVAGGANTNSSDHKAVHAVIAWKPVDRATLSLSYLYVDNNYRDSDEYWLSYPAYPDTFAGTKFTIPAGQFGPYKSGQNTNIGLLYYKSDAQLSPLLSPHSNRMSIPSLTFDYAFDKINFKSVTAYSQTNNASTPNFSYVDPASRSVTPLEGGNNLLPFNGPFIPTLPNYSSVFAITSQIKAVTQELRLSSNNPDSRLTWVAGVFYDYSQLSSNAVITANTGDLAAASIIGLPSATGTPFASLNGVGLVEPQTANETQIAAYGDATYKITEHLKATVGLRFTRDELTYALYQGGALFGFAPGVVTQVANGNITESPITPKFGLQYIVDSDLNFYVTAAKGFRPGGVNQAIPPACAASLAAAGYTSAPTTYASDSLWSYEGGAKARALGGKAAFEASAFYIDWSNVQTPITLSCGQSFTTSAAKAISQGAEFQGSIILIPGLTTSLQLSYTDAHYTSTVSSAGVNLLTAGSEIPYTPKWGAVLTGEYRFDILKRAAYIHADYSWQGRFVTGTGPGTATYLPDAYALPGANLVNARAGVTFDKFKLEVFATNLFESRDLQDINGFASGPGRVNCATAACTSYQEYAIGGIASTYRPRTVGVDVSYRY